MGIFSRRPRRRADATGPGEPLAGAGSEGIRGLWRVPPPGRAAVEEPETPPAAALEVALYAGELTAAPVEAICTSTNPRLSLEGGTGRAVLALAGWSVKREAEELVAAQVGGGGGEALGDAATAGGGIAGGAGLPVGFTGITGAGRLPYRAVIHCVASDARHRSSPAAVKTCVVGGLARAEEAGCTTVAMPVFGAGHAGLPFEEAVEAMASGLLEAATSVTRVLIVVQRPERLPAAARILSGYLGGADR